MVTKIRLLSLLLAVIGASARAGDDRCGLFPAEGFDAPDMAAFEGLYWNPNYFFAVEIPVGLKGHASPPPAPHHGFGIVLSWHPRAYLMFDGSYDSIEWHSPAVAISDHISWISEEAKEVLSVTQRGASLGDLPARAVRVVYTCKTVPETRIEDTIVAIKGGIVYTATLLTTTDREVGDEEIFSRLLATWRVQSKAPHGG